MSFELVLAILLGVGAGIFTGLTPGIHINLVAALVAGYAGLLLNHVSALFLGCFIISMSITHTFLDVLPSIFLGAPDEENALGVLPGHRYLMKGHGLMAVKLSIVGAFFGLIASILFFPLMFYALSFLYPIIKKYMAFLLMALAAYMVLRDNKMAWAVLVFCASGLFGVIVFSLGMKDPLFPMLSGLFGISTLIVSLNDNNAIPEQKHQQDIQLDRKKALIAVVLGTISSFFTSTFPGLSSSIAATMSLQAYKKLGDHGFLILTGAIGTAGFTLSLVAVLAIQKARNGSIAAISSLMEIGLSEVAIFLAAALVAGGIAVWLTLWIGVKFSSLIGKVNYKRLVISIIVFIILVGFLLSGPLGMVVLATSTAIGLIPAIVKTTRTQAMGCLMAPVILYFL